MYNYWKGAAVLIIFKIIFWDQFNINKIILVGNLFWMISECGTTNSMLIWVKVQLEEPWLCNKIEGIKLKESYLPISMAYALSLASMYRYKYILWTNLFIDILVTGVWGWGVPTRWALTSLWSPHSHTHYSDVIMGAMASQITSLTIVYSTFYSGIDQRKHQSSASLAFVWGIYRWPVNSLHKRPVTRKMFHLMTSSCNLWLAVEKKFKDHKCVTINLIWIIGCYILISSFIRMMLTVSVAVESNLHDQKS